VTVKANMPSVVIRKVCLSFLVLITLSGSASGQAKIPLTDQPITLAIHTGQYVNYPYGYSFIIPKGRKGTCSPPPMPQHGLTIDLSRQSDRSRYISFFASYDVLDFSSLDNTVEEQRATKRSEL
jgi:hypothetical protein